MLSTVIDKLSALFSPRILVASFYPLLIAAFANLYLLHRTSGWFRDWLASQQPKADLQSFIQGAVAMISLAVLASVFATLSTFLRELLEGKHWPQVLCTFFIPMEVQRRKELDDEINETLRRYFELQDAQKWIKELANARAIGSKKNRAAGYSGIPLMSKLVAAQKRGAMLDFSDLKTVKFGLAAALRKNSTAAKNADARALDRDHVRFHELFDYAAMRVDAELAKLYGRRQVRFGERETVAPTSIGNTAKALSAYGLLRYGLSIDVLFTRLQKTLQADKDYYAVVQDAKAQLDGIILLFWLTAASTLFWVLWLAARSFSLPTFFVVATAGPALCIGLYHLAATSYHAFADLIRSVVDLHRFALLENLHFPLPAGPEAEKALWDKANQWIGFAEPPVVSYEHK